MEENKPQEFPKNPLNQDLYSQIAANDEVKVEKKKKHRVSIVMLVMVNFMRWTLYLDEQKRAHQGLFNVFGYIWGTCMALLYLCGIVMLSILIYSYVQFPNYVRQYFERNGIMFTKMDIPGYVVSRVELLNLHDHKNTYRIDKLVVNSTFSDYLNGRAKSVSISGLRLNVKEDLNDIKTNNLLKLITHINNKQNSPIKIHVDSLEISDAILTLQGKENNLPISFSLTGVYGDETNMSAYVTINEPNLMIKGPLLIKGNHRKTNWSFSIHEGNITLPSHPKQKLTGKVSLSTQGIQVQKIIFDLKLVHNRLEKLLKVKLEKGRQNKFKGDVDVVWQDIAEDAVKRNIRSSINLSLVDLQFDKGGWIKTDSPISLLMKSDYSRQLQVDNVMGQLKGSLRCQLQGACTFDLKNNAAISMGRVRLPIQNEVFENTDTTTFVLEPTSKTINASLAEGKIGYNLKAKNIKFRGKDLSSEGRVLFEADKGSLEGLLDFFGSKTIGNVTVDKFLSNTSNQKIVEGKLSAKNILTSNETLEMTSPYVFLKKNDYLKRPFSLAYSSVNDVVRSVLNFNEEKIQIIYEGVYNSLNDQLDGKIVIPSFNLSDLKQPLFRFSSVFPVGIQNVSGQVSLFGQIQGNMHMGLRGPMYVAFKNVDFKTNQLDIKGLNTVLTIQTLRPFVTAPSQQMFIRNVMTEIPLQNVGVLFKLDNQFIRLNSLTASFAGIPMRADMAIVPYKDVSTLVYLRSLYTDLAESTKHIEQKNWQISGKIQGDILLPIEVKNNELAVKNADINFRQALIEYKGSADSKPKFLGKENKMYIKNGEIIVDEPLGMPDETLVQFNLDGILKPSEKGKNVREFFRGSIENWMKNIPSTTPVPTAVQSQIDFVFEQAEAQRMK